MAQATQNLEEMQVADQQNDQQVLDSMTQLRKEIGMIADRTKGAKLINEEAHKGYRELAEGKEEKKITLEELEKMKRDAGNFEISAGQVHRHIVQARKSGIISKKDEEFLMSKLIVDNIHFLDKNMGGPAKVEQIILKNLERAKKDRDVVVDIGNHPVVKKNGGYLKISDKEDIAVPTLSEFFDMSVSDRRKLVIKLKEALPEAEKYAEEVGEGDADKMTSQYSVLLKGARAKGLIGKKTFDRCEAKFKKLTNTEKAQRISEFSSYIKQYEDLWAEAKDTLSATNFSSLRGMINQKGYIELFTELGRMQEVEKKDVVKTYTSELAKYKEMKNEKGQPKVFLREHSMKKFVAWIANPELGLKQRKDVLKKLPSEMARYEKLGQDISKLSEKQQDYLREKGDIDWGHRELRAQCDRFLAGEKLPGVGADALSSVTSSTVREGIVELEKDLSERGAEKKAGFVQIVKNMFRVQENDSFGSSVMKRRVENEKKRAKKESAPESKRGDSGNVFDLQARLRKKRQQESELDEPTTQISDENLEDLGEEAEVEVVTEIGFKQIESKDETGRRQRATQLVMNEKKGMDRFFREDEEDRLRGAKDGGKDKMGFTVKEKGGELHELNETEKEAMLDYIEDKAA